MVPVTARGSIVIQANAGVGPVKDNCCLCKDPTPTSHICSECNVFLCRPHFDMGCKAHTDINKTAVCKSCNSYGHSRSSNAWCLKRKDSARTKDKKEAFGRDEEIEMFTRKNYLQSVYSPNLSARGNTILYTNTYIIY